MQVGWDPCTSTFGGKKVFALDLNENLGRPDDELDARPLLGGDLPMARRGGGC